MGAHATRRSWRVRSAALRLAALGAGLALAGGAIWLLTGPSAAKRRAPGIPRLAVGPFHAHHTPGDLAYFPRQLERSLARRLGGLKGIIVLDPGDPRPPDLRLDGEVERTAASMRLDYHLRDLAEGRLVGGGLVQGAMVDLFRLQDQVAEDIAESLSSELHIAVHAETPPRPTRDMLAYDAFLRASDLLEGGAGGSPRLQALALLEEAIARDSTFALAQVALGRALAAGLPDPRDEAGLQAALSHCRRAVNLAPALAAAHLCLGDLGQGLDDLDAALQAYRSAADLDPGSLAAWRGAGRLALRLRRLDEAVTALERVVALGDESEPAIGDLGRARHWASRARHQARPLLERAVELGHAAIRGEADPTHLHLRLAEYHALLAEEDKARRHLQDALAAWPEAPDVLFHAGVVCSELERREEALSWLQQAARNGTPRRLLRDAVELDGLRDEPRFTALVN